MEAERERQVWDYTDLKILSKCYLLMVYLQNFPSPSIPKTRHIRTGVVKSGDVASSFMYKIESIQERKKGFVCAKWVSKYVERSEPTLAPELIERIQMSRENDSLNRGRRDLGPFGGP